jgi:thioredoxin reductase
MTQVAIIGAGPYGLSVAAHLRALGVPHRIFGTPMDTWCRHMPAGMALKSDGFASNLSEPSGDGTLAAYCARHAIPYHDVDILVELSTFTGYALDFQRRFVPDLEDRQVVAVEQGGDGYTLKLDDGETLTAQAVVCAVGITHFATIPDSVAALPAELLSHSWAHHDLSGFAGRDVVVLGGGSSAVDIAVLLHEAGARATLVARRPKLHFFDEPTPGPRPLWQRLRHPSSGLGPGLRSWICQKFPQLFRFLPGRLRLAVVKRHLGPVSLWMMRGRMQAGVTTLLRHHLRDARAVDGRAHLVVRGHDGAATEIVADHVIAATGYRPDVERLEFLGDDLRARVHTHHGMPVLSGTFESSAPGLYFVGPASVNSFGPLVRFMVGAEYAAPRLARRLARQHASDHQAG